MHIRIEAAKGKGALVKLGKKNLVEVKLEDIEKYHASWSNTDELFKVVKKAYPKLQALDFDRQKSTVSAAEFQNLVHLDTGVAPGQAHDWIAWMTLDFGKDGRWVCYHQKEREWSSTRGIVVIDSLSSTLVWSDVKSNYGFGQYHGTRERLDTLVLERIHKRLNSPADGGTPLADLSMRLLLENHLWKYLPKCIRVAKYLQVKYNLPGIKVQRMTNYAVWLQLDPYEAVATIYRQGAATLQLNYSQIRPKPSSEILLKLADIAGSESWAKLSAEDDRV